MATTSAPTTLGSQALQLPTQVIYLRQTDPTLDLPLGAAFGGLDNRLYKTGDILVYNGTQFTTVSVENSGDILVVDTSRVNQVKWSGGLTAALTSIEYFNQQSPIIQLQIDNLNDESLSIGTALNSIEIDKQQIQNKITSLNLYVSGQETDIIDVNNSLIGLNSTINNTVITIANLQSGIDAIGIRVNKVNDGYTNNISQINVLTNIISSSITNIQNQQLTSAGAINPIINGDFNVWQRANTFSIGTNTVPYVSADRWHHSTGHGGNLVSTLTQVILPDTTVVNGLDITLTGNSSAFSLSYLIEDVNSITDVQTISLWLQAPSSTTLSFTVIQNFGTGGSSPVTVSSTNVTFSSITNFVYTFTLPSTTGKTIGTGSCIQLKLTGNIWTNVDICRVQLQKGNTVFPFEERQYQTELRLCQRYYESGYAVYGGYIDANLTSYTSFNYKVEKRAPPTLTFTAISQSQFTTSLGVGQVNNKITGSTYRVKNNLSSYGTYTNQYFADAELYI